MLEQENAKMHFHLRSPLSRGYREEYGGGKGRDPPPFNVQLHPSRGHKTAILSVADTPSIIDAAYRCSNPPPSELS